MAYSCTPQPTCAGACSVCPIGYLLQNGQCAACQTSNCQLCSANLTQCVSSSPGYYLSATSNVCNPCPTQCSTCIRSDTCLNCASGYTSLATMLVNSQIGGVQCLACTFPCVTCEGTQDYCTSCAPGYQFSGWKCTQIFNFKFAITLSASMVTFNTNYFSFIQALSSAIGTSDSSIVSIAAITFGSVIINGGLAPTTSSGTIESNLQYSDFQSALSQNSNIAGMSITSSSIEVEGGSINYDKVDLGLILGICIPVGVLSNFINNF